MIYLKAKYIVCTPEIILEDSCIGIEKGLIMDISSKECRQASYDFGESIMTPGLINPHTHLEGPELYGYSRNPLKPPQKFTEWAVKTIARRHDMDADDFAKTVEHGYQVCAQNGVTTIADHTHIDNTLKAHLKAKLRRFLLEEAVALDKEKAGWRYSKTLEDIKYAEKAIKKSRLGGLVKIGVAPHAPFSVSAELYKMLFSLAQKKHMVFSTHLSELKEEIEFLKTGKGKMLDYLKEIGRDTPNWKTPGVSPVSYFRKMDILKPPAFFVHCNYLSPEDIKLIAQSGASVIFCPISHNYFGHSNHPFRKLLQAGVNVALGTDGLGSNSDLSILKEMRFILQNYDGITPNQVFKMGTVNGAKALGIDKTVGVIRPGYAADIAVFPIKKSAAPKTSEQVIPCLIDQSPASVFTMVNGAIITKKC